MKDQSPSSRQHSLPLLALGIILAGFLTAVHDRLPLWVEGMPEYEAQLGAMLGVRHEHLPCALRVGSIQIPLAVAPYVGGGFIYLHAPFVAAWYRGLTSDPYFFRFVGILAFLLDGWLIFFIASRLRGPRTGRWAAALWLTTPNLVLVSIADLQFELIPLVFLLVSSALFLQFLSSGRSLPLLAAAFLLGMTATTRIDPLLLFVVATAAWLAIMRPVDVYDALKSWTHGRRSRLMLIPGLFLLGALPFVAYNVLCPSGRILTFLSSKVLEWTFASGGPSIATRLSTRIGQYFLVNVLHEMPFLNVTTPNPLFLIAWIASVIFILRDWRRGTPSFLLFAIATLIPLSVLSTGVLRPEHMISFQVLTTMMVATGLTARWEGQDQSASPTTSSRLSSAFLVMVLSANLFVLALDWRGWQHHSVHEDAITNQSAPVLLLNQLRKYAPEDRILFTNIGLWPYMEYLSAGRLKGEDLVSWNGTEDFVNAVSGVLRDRKHRRVFVAVSPARDGGRFNFERTRVLYELLRANQVPFTVERLSSPRRQDIYDLITVPKGAGIARPSAAGIGIFRNDQALFALAFGRQPRYADVQFQFGQPGDTPLAGDWTGRGITTVGVYRPSTSTFYLRNTNSSGDADLVVRFGSPGDLPVTGDWDGNGTSTVGLYRRSTRTFHLRNTNSDGPPDLVLTLRSAAGIPISGDWDGNGTTTVGTFDPETATFVLWNAYNPQSKAVSFVFGRKGDVPMAGDWNGDGRDTIGVYRPAENTFLLRDFNSTGQADRSIQFGIASDLPLSGHWNG